jgi:toxin ParE1/3/4
VAFDVVFRPAAEEDLYGIYEYIRDKNADPVIALGFISRIRDHCLKLSDFPLRGTARDDLRPGLRILGLEKRVVVAFVVEGDTVRIARVFYGGRNYETLLRVEG